MEEKTGTSGNFLERLYSSRHTERAVDLLSIWLVVCGIYLAIMDLLGAPAPLGQVLLLGAGVVLLVGICAHIWWLGPALVLLGGLAAAAPLLQGVAPGEWWETCTAYIGWVLNAMVYRAPVEAGWAQPLGHALLLLPLSILVYLYVRRFFAILPLCVATGALAVLLFYRGTMLEPVLCLLGAAVIILLPRVAHRWIVKRGEGGQGVTKTAMQLIGVPIALACVVLSFWIVPEDEIWRSKWMGDLSSDLWDMYYYSRGIEGEGGYAAADQEILLGGDLELGRDRVYTVKIEQPHALRMAVFDTYDGARWYNAQSPGQFRYKSVFVRRLRGEVFRESLPMNDADARALYDLMTQELSYRVLPSSNRQPQMGVIGYPRTVETTSTSVKDYVYFDDQGEVFLLGHQPIQTNYEITSAFINRDLDNFDANMARFEALAQSRGIEVPEEITGRYLQLPDRLPADIADTARRVTLGAQTPYAQAQALELWLADQFVYSTTPGDIPQGMDFVESFLEAGEGYCTHFASALTVMARSLGLPARYVQGFLVEKDPAVLRHSYIAYEYLRHAWTEIYFAGLGWVAFDPLDIQAGRGVEAIYQPFESGALTPTMEPEPTPWVTEAPPVEIEWELEERQETPLSFWAVLLLALGGVILLGAACMAAVRISRGRGALARVSRKRTSRQTADYYYAGILSQLAYWGMEVAPGETIAMFAARVDAAGLVKQPMEDIAQMMMRMRYGDIDPPQEALQAMARYFSTMEQALYETLGWFGYLVRRAILQRAKLR